MTLGRDVNAVQELTDILILHSGGLLDLGTGEGDLGDINPRDLDLVLNIGGSKIRHALQKGNSASLLLSQEVADLHNLLTINSGSGHIDRKVGITKSHLVRKSPGNTSDHVLDMGADSSALRE